MSRSGWRRRIGPEKDGVLLAVGSRAESGPRTESGSRTELLVTQENPEGLHRMVREGQWCLDASGDFAVSRGSWLGGGQ